MLLRSVKNRIKELVRALRVMVGQRAAGAEGEFVGGVGVLRDGRDVPAVVGVEGGEAEHLVVLAPQSAQLVVVVAVRLAEHVGVFGDALYNKKGRARL